jgi:hypothetical protein
MLAAGLSFNVFAQDIPEDELNVRINSYFDNFRVTVIYPQVSITKKIGSNTSISARYLSDIISAASMRMYFPVDGVTSATTRKEGGADNTPDEWRHEFGAGIIQRFFSGILSLNGQYSTEHDYSSTTMSGSISYPFAKKNTVLTLSTVINLDKVFPQTRTWTKDRNTYTFNIGLTQVLSKSIITQFDASYMDLNGYMLDGYQVIRIISGNSYASYEPSHPYTRVRRAIGWRANFGLTKKASMQLGYRYYWDSWDIQSNTISASLSNHFTGIFSASFEYRHYFQTRAFFFKPVYTQVEQYMTVDDKLNSGYSDEVTVNLTLRGKKGASVSLFSNEKFTWTGSFGFYRRYLDSPNWITHYNILYAYLFSIGLRYNF